MHGQEAERSLHDALCVIRCLVHKRFMIAGGAAAEVEVATQLSRWAKTLVVRSSSFQKLRSILCCCVGTSFCGSVLLNSECHARSEITIMKRYLQRAMRACARHRPPQMLKAGVMLASLQSC